MHLTVSATTLGRAWASTGRAQRSLVSRSTGGLSRPNHQPGAGAARPHWRAPRSTATLHGAGRRHRKHARAGDAGELGVARRVPADAGRSTSRSWDFRPCLPCGATWRVERVTHDVLSLEQLSHNECVQLLTPRAGGSWCSRWAALPAIVPVTFAVLDDAVVMCTAPDNRVAAAADGALGVRDR